MPLRAIYPQVYTPPDFYQHNLTQQSDRRKNQFILETSTIQIFRCQLILHPFSGQKSSNTFCIHQGCNDFESNPDAAGMDGKIPMPLARPRRPLPQSPFDTVLSSFNKTKLRLNELFNTKIAHWYYAIFCNFLFLKGYFLPNYLPQKQVTSHLAWQMASQDTPNSLASPPQTSFSNRSAEQFVNYKKIAQQQLKKKVWLIWVGYRWDIDYFMTTGILAC